MRAPTFHLAQLNIARLREPLDSPALAPFVDSLLPVNAVADTSDGFVWRLQTDDGDATALRPFDDDWIMVNLSLWDSLESLRTFVSGPLHRAIMVRRREFFERMTEAYLVLWWVPAGQIPTVADAKERLAHLRRNGACAWAFDFRHPFPSPDAAADEEDGTAALDAWEPCSAG